METRLYRSDTIEVTANLERWVEIEYTNGLDFAGVIYSGSAPPVFRIYVEALLFKERFQEETDSEKDNADVVKLRSAVKKQRNLEVEPVPYYVVEIIKLALHHNTVKVDGIEYVKEEEISQRNLNTHFPFESVEVWLTEKSSRNVNILT